MKYQLELEISKPREQVATLLLSHDVVPHWQPTFLSAELKEGTQGTAGAKSFLRYKMGFSTLTMTEEIEATDLPACFTVVYENKSVWNRAVNRFEEIDADNTRWIVEHEFQCSWFFRMMQKLMPNMFKDQSLKDMQAFKAYAESLTHS